jgi:hypothetical protein
MLYAEQQGPRMSYIIYYIVECNLPKWMFLCKMYFTADTDCARRD